MSFVNPRTLCALLAVVAVVNCCVPSQSPTTTTSSTSTSTSTTSTTTTSNAPCEFSVDGPSGEGGGVNFANDLAGQSLTCNSGTNMCKLDHGDSMFASDVCYGAGVELCHNGGSPAECVDDTRTADASSPDEQIYRYDCDNGVLTLQQNVNLVNDLVGVSSIFCQD